MDINELLMNYFEYKCTQTNIEELIKENNLQLILSNKHNKDDFLYYVNSFKRNINKKIIFEIRELFNNHDVKFLIFKGEVLAQILYNDPNVRIVGDIDIWVSDSDFEKSLNILLDNGFKFVNDTEHHMILVKGSSYIELHRRILMPELKIDDTFLINNTTVFEIDGKPLETFNITSTFLHLIYHLYMDQYLRHRGTMPVYKFFAQIPIKANRFLYRAYEIALFSKKYHSNIDWDRIVLDIESQNLYTAFKEVIISIENIFPKTFSEQFIDKILRMKYSVIKSSPKSEFDILECKNMEMFINKTWGGREIFTDKKYYISESSNSILNKNATYMIYNGDVDISKYGFNVLVKNNDNKISLILEFDNEILKNINEKDFIKNIKLGVLLSSVQNYKYKYFVLKLRNNECGISVEVLDKINDEVIKESAIQPMFYQHDKNCILDIGIDKSYFPLVDKEFLLNIIIAYDDTNEKYMLALAGNKSNWCDPRSFLKVVEK